MALWPVQDRLWPPKWRDIYFLTRTVKILSEMSTSEPVTPSLGLCFAYVLFKAC